MHYLDEIMALYTGRDPQTQKYLLATLSTVPVGFDGDILIDFLWREAVSRERPIRHQARRELGRVLPVFLRHEYGLLPTARGVWSSYQDRAHVERILAQEAGEEVAGIARRIAAGMHALAPSLELALGEGRQATVRCALAASLVAGRVRTRSGLLALVRRASSDPPSVAHAAALAELGGEEAETALLSAVDRWGLRSPDLIVLLAGLPAERTIPLLERFEARTDAYGRAAIAQALSGDDSSPGRRLLARLIDRHEGWVTAYALDAIHSAPRPDDLEVTSLAYRTEPHEFVRVQAVKAAGHIPSPGAVDFLMERLADGTPRVQAAALEALVRKRIDPRDLAPAAVPLLTSPILRARIASILVVARVDAPRVAGPVHEILFSDQPVCRLEGAFVLGYLPGPESASALVKMALRDPSLPVQVQALKSLARQPIDLAIERLLIVLEAAGGRLAAVAARALASLEGPLLSRVEEGLVRAATSTTSPAIKGVILRAIGAVASRQPRAGPPPILADHLEDPAVPVVLGALEGLKFMGDHAAADRVLPLLQAADRRVRARAALTSFLGGDLAGLPVLGEVIAEPAEEVSLAGLEALLEIAAALPGAVRSPRFSRLAAVLDAGTRDPAFQSYNEREAPSAPAIRARTIEAPAPPTRSPGPEEVTAPIVGHATDTKLEDWYESRQVPAAGEPPLGPERLAEATTLGSLPPVPPPAWPLWVPIASLVAVAVATVLALTALVVRPRPTAPSSTPGGSLPAETRPIARGTLRVGSVEGSASTWDREGAGTSIQEGHPVLPGDSVSTDQDARLSLFDGDGNAVWLGASSRLTLGATAIDATAPDQTAFVFLDPSGDVLLDFRRTPPGKGVEVVIGSHRLHMRWAKVRVQRLAGSVTVAVLVGSAALSTRRGGERILGVGDSVAVEP